MAQIIQGNAYVLGDNIDTDQIIPARHLVYNLDDPKERKWYGAHALSGVPEKEAGLPAGYIPFILKGKSRSDFSIIVAGKNFGCGSSREHAPVALQMAGVRLVVATSYARIFYRNAVDGGFLIPLECKNEIFKQIETGEEVEIQYDTNRLIHKESGKQYTLKPLGEVSEIIHAGGIFEFARKHQMLK